MPWILYDIEDETYYCVERWNPADETSELWRPERHLATRYATEKEAQAALEAVDVEDWLSDRIFPTWVSPTLRPWSKMTLAERLAQVEQDHQDKRAEDIERAFAREPPHGPHIIGTVTARLPVPSPRQHIRQKLARERNGMSLMADVDFRELENRMVDQLLKGKKNG